MPPQVQGPGSGSTPVVKQAPAGVESVDNKQIETPKEQQPPPQPPPKPSDAEVAARRSEKNVEGTARQIELHNQLHKKDASVAEFSAKAKAIAENPKLKEGPKQEELRKLMQSGGKEEFERVIADSKGWSYNAKFDFAHALGKSDPLMKRIASDLPKDVQPETVNNVYSWSAGGHEIAANVSKWIKNADPSLLNKAIEKGTSVDEPGGLIADKISYQNDKDTLSKLSDKSKAAVLDNFMFLGDSAAKRPFAHTAREVYQGLPAEHKNGLVDSLQENGRLKDFVQIMDPKNVVQGMTPQNAGVIAAEYNNLATTKKDSRWSNAAGQIDGYAENHFKSADYEEYLKTRDRYHSR
jgi:hypothetical protein